MLFLFVVLKVVLKEKLDNQGEIFYGIGLTIVGMCIFNHRAHLWTFQPGCQCGEPGADGVHGSIGTVCIAALCLCGGTGPGAGVCLVPGLWRDDGGAGAERPGHDYREISPTGYSKRRP